MTCVLLFSVPGVSASSVGTIGFLGPASGPVDALVTLEINQYPGAATMYTLAATTTSPDQGGCGSAQSLSGVAPFQVDPNRGADVRFYWPASLGKGSYWFCATSVNGSAPAAMSQPSAPYTVLTNAAPTVQVDASSAVAQAGATITIHLANWLTSDGNATPQVALLPQGVSPIAAEPLVAQQSGSGDAAGNYTLTATLPSFIAASGQYAIVVEGACGRDPLSATKATVCAVLEQSALFAIAQSSMPTTAATAPASTPLAVNPGDGSNAAIPWIALVIGIILLALIVGLVAVLARRASARKRQAQAARYRRDRNPVYWHDDQRQDSRYDQRQDSRSRG